jgi:hypothetical protein
MIARPPCFKSDSMAWQIAGQSVMRYSFSGDVRKGEGNDVSVRRRNDGKSWRRYRRYFAERRAPDSAAPAS